MKKALAKPETHNTQARYVAELVKASGVKRPRKVEIECGRLLVTGSDLKAEYFKFVAAAASDRPQEILLLVHVPDNLGGCSTKPGVSRIAERLSNAILGPSWNVGFCGYKSSVFSSNLIR